MMEKGYLFIAEDFFENIYEKTLFLGGKDVTITKIPDEVPKDFK